MNFENYIKTLGTQKGNTNTIFDYIIELSNSDDTSSDTSDDISSESIFVFQNQNININNLLKEETIPSSIKVLLILVKNNEDFLDKFNEYFLLSPDKKKGKILNELEEKKTDFGQNLFRSFFKELREQNILLGYEVDGIPWSIWKKKKYIFVIFDQPKKISNIRDKLSLGSLTYTYKSKIEYELLSYIYVYKDEYLIEERYNDSINIKEQKSIVLCVYKTDAVPFNTGVNTSIVYNSFGTPRAFNTLITPRFFK
jgi:hypothetical protein